MTILNDVDITISYPVYGGPDADEPTGAREPVLVTQIRIDEDADCEGDPPEYVDRSTYYIEKAHRIVFGASIPDEELSLLSYLNSERNGWALLEDEEDELYEYVRARLEDEDRREHGFA